MFRGWTTHQVFTMLEFECRNTDSLCFNILKCLAHSFMLMSNRTMMSRSSARDSYIAKRPLLTITYCRSLFQHSGSLSCTVCPSIRSIAGWLFGRSTRNEIFKLQSEFVLSSSSLADNSIILARWLQCRIGGYESSNELDTWLSMQ